MRKCSHAYRHIQGIYSSLGTGDILVRMLGSWEKIMVDQRRSRRSFKQMKHSVLSIGLSHDLHACVNVLMYIDIFKGNYTSLGTGDILVRMLGSWETIMADQCRSRRIFKQVKHALLSIELSHDLHTCVNVRMHIDIFRGMYTSLGTADMLVRMLERWEKIMVDQRRSRRIFKQVEHSVLSIELSHNLHACVNVLMHIDIFREIYTSLGTGDILVRMLKRWEKIVVDQRRSRRIFMQVKHSVLSPELSHNLHACVNVLMHIDIFRGMYTSLGIGCILVRMLGSWEKIMIDQRWSRRMFKQVKYSILSLEHSHDLHVCVNFLMHIDIFSGMYTSLGTGDILVRMLGSWEIIMVDQRSSRRMFKQVKYSILSFELSHDLHACLNVLMHIDIFSGMYTSLGTADILVRMLGSWEKIMVAQRRSRRMFKQVKYSILSLELSHDLRACVNVLMHVDIFSGMSTSLGTGDILVRMLGSWEKIMVYQSRSRRMCKQVKYTILSLELSHYLHAFVNVLMHIDIFSGMYTSLGTGYILVRMLESWKKIMVDQRRSRRIFKQVKYPILSLVFWEMCNWELLYFIHLLEILTILVQRSAVSLTSKLCIFTAHVGLFITNVL